MNLVENMDELPRSEDVFRSIERMKFYYKSRYYVPTVEEMKVRLTETTGLQFGRLAGEGATKHDRLCNSAIVQLSVVQRDLERELSAQVEYLEDLEEEIRQAMRRCKANHCPRIPQVLSHYCDLSDKDIAESIPYGRWLEERMTDIRISAQVCKSANIKASADYMASRTGMHPKEIEYVVKEMQRGKHNTERNRIAADRSANQNNIGSATR